MTTASQIIEAYEHPADAREAVLFKAHDGYKLVILMDDKAVALNFKDAAARNVTRAWKLLDAAFFAEFWSKSSK